MSFWFRNIKCRNKSVKQIILNISSVIKVKVTAHLCFSVIVLTPFLHVLKEWWKKKLNLKASKLQNLNQLSFNIRSTYRILNEYQFSFFLQLQDWDLILSKMHTSLYRIWKDFYKGVFSPNALPASCFHCFISFLMRSSAFCSSWWHLSTF